MTPEHIAELEKAYGPMPKLKWPGDEDNHNRRMRKWLEICLSHEIARAERWKEEAIDNQNLLRDAEVVKRNYTTIEIESLDKGPDTDDTEQ